MNRKPGEKKLPTPPPLPADLNTRFHQKGLAITGSQMRGSFVVPNAGNSQLDRLFDDGYRADVLILTDGGGVIYTHACILGIASPVLKAMLMKSKGEGRNRRLSISIHGVPPDAVRVFIRFLYSSCYEEENMKEYVLPLLVLSHAYMVPQLKRLCEWWLEQKLITTENAIDVFQLALLCDAPRLSLICLRYILANFEAVSASDGWKVMKESHPVLEEEILESIPYQAARLNYKMRRAQERKIYIQLYKAMEALVHICRDGCRTIGPRDKSLRDDQAPCKYAACRGLETLLRHLAGCKLRSTSGCVHCKRMWQILELHSWICANSNACRVPLCRNLRRRRRNQSKKEDIKWSILVKKIVRSKSITGAPFFSLKRST